MAVFCIILTVWAAQAGAKRVYAIEYTDMAKHARRAIKANGVDHIVTVIQGAVEEVVLPEEDWDTAGPVGLALQDGDEEETVGGKKNQKVVDIILSGEYIAHDLFVPYVSALISLASSFC